VTESSNSTPWANKPKIPLVFPDPVVRPPTPIEILARVAARTGEPDRAIAALQKLLSRPYAAAHAASQNFKICRAGDDSSDKDQDLFLARRPSPHCFARWQVSGPALLPQLHR
jgi:hypothetical protein